MSLMQDDHVIQAFAADTPDEPLHVQTTSRFPFRPCGMTPTVSRISQRDEPPTQHHAQEEAFDSTEATWAHPRGDADLIQSTSLHNGVHQMMTRFGKGGRPCAATAVVQRDEAHDSCG
jgi:hypothetical protein